MRPRLSRPANIGIAASAHEAVLPFQEWAQNPAAQVMPAAWFSWNIAKTRTKEALYLTWNLLRNIG
jgi:hypothetical protein